MSFFAASASTDSVGAPRPVALSDFDGVGAATTGLLLDDDDDDDGSGDGGSGGGGAATLGAAPALRFACSMNAASPIVPSERAHTRKHEC